MSADGLQNRRAVHGVEGIGDVHRNSRLGRDRTVPVVPLASGVDDGLATIWCLQSELYGLKNGACPIRDELNSHLASDTSEGFANIDRTECPVRFAKRLNGRSTDEWANGLGNLSLEKKIDHLRDETKQKIRRDRPGSISDMGGP